MINCTLCSYIQFSPISAANHFQKLAKTSTEAQWSASAPVVRSDISVSPKGHWACRAGCTVTGTASGASRKFADWPPGVASRGGQLSVQLSVLPAEPRVVGSRRPNRSMHEPRVSDRLASVYDGRHEPAPFMRRHVARDTERRRRHVARATARRRHVAARTPFTVRR